MGRRPPRSKPLADPAANQSKKRRPSSSARGYDHHHEAARVVLLSRYPVCQWCNSAFSEHYHHTCGDSFCRDLSHAAAICEACHTRHHAELRRHRP